jgi:hypothetical protein
MSIKIGTELYKYVESANENMLFGKENLYTLITRRF